MDLALRGWPSNGHGQEALLIVDWKTGQKRPQDTVQLLCYALYAHSRWGAEPARLVCRLEHLSAGSYEIIGIDNEQIEAIKEKIRRSIAAMRGAVRYPLLNLAVKEDFPKIDDRRTCLRCNFRAVCKPELKKEELEARSWKINLAEATEVVAWQWVKGKEQRYPLLYVSPLISADTCMNLF